MELPLDIWGHLTKSLENDRDKCHLMMTCKNISKCEFYFNNRIDFSKIMNITWLDRFTNIYVDGYSDFPRFGLTNTSFVLPLFATHLAFHWGFNKSIKNCIPSSVTHLTFGVCFNQPIYQCIPPSVKHLTFDWEFNQPIKDSIPFGVTHLTFGWRFNQSIENCIPSSVTHLMLCHSFAYPINGCIPSSVIEIIFLIDQLPSWKNNIVSRITRKDINIHFFDLYNWSCHRKYNTVNDLLKEINYRRSNGYNYVGL